MIKRNNHISSAIFLLFILLSYAGMTMAEVNSKELSRANIMETKSLQTFDGKKVSLDQFTGKGKWTVIMVWAHDCHACNQEAAKYEAFHKKHRNKDAIILGITVDGPENINKSKAFVKRNGITFKNLTLTREYFMLYHRVMTKREFVGTPTFILFSPKGVLKAQQAGAVPVEIIEDFIKSNKNS